MNVPVEKNGSFSRELQQTLRSRHLLRTELSFSDEMIEWHIKNGYITAENSISINKRRYRCNRCGQTDQRYFSFYHSSGKNKLYCRSCVMMGRVSEEVPLYSWKEENESNWKSIKLTWDGKLSSGQQKAANVLIEAISKKKSSSSGRFAALAKQKCCFLV